MLFAALQLLSGVRAPILARLARIDPIVSPQSVKGQQVSCILFHSVTFCISGSASSSIWCCFCAAPAPLSDVARQNDRHPQGSSDRTRAKSKATPRYGFVLPIMAFWRHTFCVPFY
jgi:hypothetical protein